MDLQDSRALSAGMRRRIRKDRIDPVMPAYREQRERVLAGQRGVFLGNLIGGRVAGQRLQAVVCHPLGVELKLSGRRHEPIGKGNERAGIVRTSPTVSLE